MKKNIYILAVILTFSLSCKLDVKDENYDKKKTFEFISQLLKEEGTRGNKSFLNCNCVLEQSIWKSELIEPEFKAYLQENLKIEDNDFLKFQIDLFNKFKITKKIVPEKNMITNAEYIEFKRSFKNNEFAYLDWMEKQDCQKGFFSISKPLFNENYDNAIIRFEKNCGPMCGGGLIIIYELKKEKWIEKKILDNWIQ